MLLEHIVQAGASNQPYVYLGYWVRGSEKMDYKVRFSPIELLRPGGWALAAARELTAETAGFSNVGRGTVAQRGPGD
jgi:arginine-tRNA-protein transferase